VIVKVSHLDDHQIYDKKTKHINDRLHFVRDFVEFGEVKIEKIVLEKNPTYILFMKFLPRSMFKRCLKWIIFFVWGHRKIMLRWNQGGELWWLNLNYVQQKIYWRVLIYLIFYFKLLGFVCLAQLSFSVSARS